MSQAGNDMRLSGENRIRLAVILLLAVVLWSCQVTDRSAYKGDAPSTAEAPEGAPARLTAHGWGALRIGMTRAEVVAAAGEDAHPEAVGGPDPEACEEFRPSRAPEGMLVMIEQGQLTRISVSKNTDVETEHGFRVGDAAEEIKAAKPGQTYDATWGTGWMKPDTFLDVVIRDLSRKK